MLPMTALRILSGNVIRPILIVTKQLETNQRIKTIYTSLIAFILGYNVYTQDTILPLWPKDAVPNRIETDEKEIREIGAIEIISYVQYPQIEVYVFLCTSPGPRNCPRRVVKNLKRPPLYIQNLNMHLTDF